MCREQKMKVANGDFLNKTMLLCEFRLAVLYYWLTFEHSVLSETAGQQGSKLSDRNPVRPDEREAMKCLCCLYKDKEKMSDSALN